MLKKSFTKEEKKEITEAADALGLEYVIKGGSKCRECYDKLLVRIYEKTDVEAAVSLDGWRLKNPRESFRLMGQLWDNATLAEREVGNLHPHVLEIYFEKA